MTHNHLRRTVSAGAAFAISAFGVVAFAAPASAQEADKVIDFAVISDFHGHIENAAALDYQIDQMKAANPNTHFISVGDNVGGSAYVSAVDADNPTMDILNAMGLEVSAGGNHEFDKGYNDFAGRIVDRVDADYLVSNVAGVDATKIPPYVIKTWDGVRVAFIGSVTDELPTLVSPSAIAGLTVSDPVAATDALAAQLKDGNTENGEADVVVALMHTDLTAGPNLVGENVDLAFGGHSHIQQLGKTESGAATAEPINYGTAFIKAQVVVKADGTVTSTTAVGDAFKEEIGDNGRSKLVPLGESEDIKALYEAASAKAKELGADPVGFIDRDAERGSRMGDGAEGSNRGTESPASNLIADAFYKYGQSFQTQPDLGLMNPGGVRADFKFAPNTEMTPTDLEGLITKGESNTVQPFGNVYGMADYTGAQLYTMLEQQWKAPDAEHPMLRLGLSSNVEYTYDPSAETGSHIIALYIDGKLVANDDSMVYTVASNTFLLEGGDGFTVLGDGASFLDTGMIDNDAFNDYLSKFPQDKPLHVDYTQRSIGVKPYPTEVKAGDTVTIELSSLAMTAGEATPKTVTVTFNGVPVEATVDATPNAEGYDESGMATVTWTVPADFAGKDVTVELTAGDGVEGGDSVTVALPMIKVAPMAVEPEPMAVTPMAVTSNVTPDASDPASCTVKPFVTIPETEGVEYSVNGKAVKAGKMEYGYGETVTVTAKALEGYTLADGAQAEWTFKAPSMADLKCPVPTPKPADTLKNTGSSVGLVGGAMVALLLAGAGLTVAARRK